MGKMLLILQSTELSVSVVSNNTLPIFITMTKVSRPEVSYRYLCLNDIQQLYHRYHKLQHVNSHTKQTYRCHYESLLWTGLNPTSFVKCSRRRLICTDAVLMCLQPSKLSRNSLSPNSRTKRPIPRNFRNTICFLYGCETWSLTIWVKVKLSLFFNEAPCHEGVLGEWMYSSTHYLTSALDGGEWSASRPGRFTPRERAPGTHWIGDWVGPRASLDALVKRKIPSLIIWE
jgi:hypothetical protein